MPDRQPTLEGTDAYLSAIRDPAQNLLQRFQNDPEGLAERLGLKLPQKPLQVMRELGLYDPEVHGPIVPGLREMVLDVCTLAVRSAVAVGPRGGGKSLGVSFIEFFLWMLKSFDALNLGGSELQATNVYNYLTNYIESDPEWAGHIKGEVKISETTKKDKSWIKVMAASSKSVRSPHAGGIRNVNGQLIERGGLLVIDEEAEADPEIVKAALFTINTARPSVNLRCSTFHNAEGTFAEVVEDHEEMGYTLYEWDVFDVAERCDCTGGICQSEEKCFREDHYEQYENLETGETENKLMHRAYCGGRAQYADGWVPMEEIISTWRRLKRNHRLWDVEAMGSAPGMKGHVVKDQKTFLKNFQELTPSEAYQPGSPIIITVDWGATNAAVGVWQRQYTAEGERHVQLHADLVEQAGQTQIFGVILGYWTMYPEAQKVKADIGGGGNYLNPKLRQDEGIPCDDVNFAEDKEAAAAVWNLLQESEGTVVYLEDQDDFKRQVKKWKRKNGRIKKGDDHLCDQALCYFAEYIESLGMSHIRIAPRTFGTDGEQPVSVRSPSASNERPAFDTRVPVVRGIS